MQVSDEEALSAPSSPASKSQSRARGSLPPLAGHQPLGPDDDPFANKGRRTPRDTTEGLDQDTLFWSDHSDPYHTTLGLSSRVSERRRSLRPVRISPPARAAAAAAAATTAAFPRAATLPCAPDRSRAAHRDGRRHALADRAAAAQAVAAPPSGGCMRRPLPVGLSPRSGRSFAPGRRFPVCGVDSAVIHPPDSSASRRGLRGHSRWPRGRRGITLPPEQRVVLPLLARVLRCAAPRLCCLPG